MCRMKGCMNSKGMRSGKEQVSLVILRNVRAKNAIQKGRSRITVLHIHGECK